MPSTRAMKDFKVTTTSGTTISVRRRCRGSGVTMQKHLDTLLYDEAAKKFKSKKKGEE
jgi:hypothetical protein